MEWISVKEKMPENDQRVLVWDTKFREQRILVCNHEYGCWDTEDGDDIECKFDPQRITHWCPLPESPNIEGGF